MQDLSIWLASRRVEEFPYEAVVREFLLAGKHHVAPSLLRSLDDVRATLPGMDGPLAELRTLDGFLDNALDKWDGRYDYRTYLCLSLLPMPRVHDAAVDPDRAGHAHDRLLVQLIADMMRFELDAADDRTELLPELRPDALTAAKRCRLGMRAAQPAVRRLMLGVAGTAANLRAARRLCLIAEHNRTPAERRTLLLTNLPVHVVHDEYMFIRVLQSFESTFALLAVWLADAVAAVAAGDGIRAVHRIEAADCALHEAAPLFSLLATMQVEAFRTFRAFTEGASAIQSRNYKIVESLCRRPDAPRLDSAAFGSVPEIKARVLASEIDLDQAVAVARAAGRISESQQAALDRALRRFATTLVQWRQTHYRLAVRMLGERPGTGYTEGTPYLNKVRKIPVFQRLPEDRPTAKQPLAQAEEPVAQAEIYDLRKSS
jgi:tryptophan 2,3-dioxygenase